jgi:hypothetical protein
MSPSNRHAVWPFIIVMAGLVAAVYWGAFSPRHEPSAAELAGPFDARACEGLMLGLAVAVLADDEAMVRRHLHPALIARLPSDRPLTAQIREILPDAPVLRRFDSARFETDAPTPAGEDDRARTRLRVDLGGGARFEATVLAGPHDGHWKLLGLAE